MNETSFSRLLNVSNCFGFIESTIKNLYLVANSKTLVLPSFVILVLIVCCVEAGVSEFTDCSDAQGAPDTQLIDSSRIGLSINNPRIVYSGTGNVFSTRKSIDYTKRKPDFCLKYVIRENTNAIDSFSICYKFKKYSDELSSSFGVGFGRSNYSDKKSISSITSFIARSDTSTEIKNHFVITSRKLKQDLKVILAYDSAGISTLSNVTDSNDVLITKIDCKYNKSKCKPSYDF